MKERLAGLFRDHAEGLAGAVRGILGRKAEISEVLQESFLRSWRGLATGLVPKDPVAWIFVVTLNTSKDLRRRRRIRQPGLPLEEVDSVRLTAAGPAPGTVLEREEAVEAARAAIHDLRDAEKEVFLLRVSAGLTFEAIGDSLGIPVGTAKTRMRAALLRLRATLSEFSPVPARRKEVS